MRKVFWRRHGAAKAVLTCLEDYRTHWERNAHITESADSIEDLTGAISAAAQRQGDNQTPGHTNDKNDSQDAMLEAGFGMCMKLKVFGRKTKNAVLLADCDFSETSFSGGTDEEQIERCERMTRLATQHLDALATYDITAGDVAALNSLIEAVKPKEGKRDAVGAQRTQATASIPDLMKALSAKLRELDEEIEAFMTKPEQKEFRETYFIARRVKDYKGKGKKVEAAG
ncbi:hypothetical protein [Flaviaesturariibacter aridisoli]|uniref:Uncharacterized protein n=1 Tax=Flaviaesturariibacter aridisoli TaxID=2545761 RepID=A0A4R4E0H8_9BACT|nr:hypothetical protein [Flaviaesturariibacter aridisoli]TCZ68860.1 hypothetical protein E0486_13355 [Flaviaesturariibacter aridisoli]